MAAQLDEKVAKWGDFQWRVDILLNALVVLGLLTRAAKIQEHAQSARLLFGDRRTTSRMA